MNAIGSLLEYFISIAAKDNASDDISKIGKTASRTAEEISKSMEKAGGGYEKFNEKAKRVSNDFQNQQKKLQLLKEKYIELYSTLGGGAEETQKIGAEIYSLSGKVAQNGQILREAASAADQFDQSLEQIPENGEKIQSFSDILDGSLTKIGAALAGAFTAKKIVDFGVACVKTAAETETAFAKVNTLLAADTNTKKYFDSIKTAAAETGVTVNAFSEAVYSAISASVDQASAVEFTTQAVKLAKGGFTDTATAVDVLTTIINAYGMSAQDATSIADKLITTQNLGKTTVGELAAAMGRVIPTARAYNVSLDTVASAYAVMTKNGIATAETTTYLNGMLNELGKSGSIASKALKEATGQSFAELMASGMSLGEVIQILQGQAKKAGVAINEMFSSQEAGKAASTISQNVEDLNSIMVSMQNSAGAAEEAFGKMASTLDEKINKLKVAWGLLMSDAGEQLSPLLGKLVDVTTGFINGVRTSGQEGKVVANSYEEAAAKAENYLAVTNKMKSAHKDGTPWLKSDLNMLKMMEGAYQDAVQLMLDFQAENAATSESVQEMPDAFKAATEEYVASSTQLMQTYHDSYVQTLESVQSWFKPFQEASAGVSVTFNEIKENMQSQIDFNNKYAENLQYLSENGLGNLEDALKSYGASGAAYASAIVEAMQEAGGAATEEGAALINELLGLFSGVEESQTSLASNFTDMSGEIAEQLQKISEDYAAFATSLDKTGEARDAANNTIAGFIGGLNAGIPGVEGVMRTLGSRMTSALQGSLKPVTITVNAKFNGASYPGKAIGMDYVPFNEMPAMLHRGEAVLSAYEADQWRRGRSGGNSQGVTIVQNIHAVPQTPVQLAAATQAAFEQARWTM